MKKLLTLILAAVLCLGVVSMTACGKDNRETLIVYTEAGFAPWEFTAKGSTEIIGIDMEIAKYIANKYDYKLVVNNGSFDAIVAGINEDNAIAIFSLIGRKDLMADAN